MAATFFAHETGAAALVMIALLSVSCTTERVDMQASLPPRQEPREAPSRIDADEIFSRPIGQRVGTSFAANVRFFTEPLGAIPYDNETLPLVSPDGRFLATQTGLAPGLETVLAQPGAAIPASSRIEIHALPDAPDQSPTMIAVVDQPALLGRSCRDDGFLIEAARENGARWIGLVSWETGRTTWLIDDDQAVSAFASLGPGGQLAFSRRPLNGSGFSLTVRLAGQQWSFPADQGDWLMPTWSGLGDGLFALLLRGDMLDAVHMIATDASTARRTLRIQPLATSEANRNIAFRTLNSVVNLPGGPAPARHELFFFHPAHRAAALWRPPDPPAVFQRHSFVAVADHNDPRSMLLMTDRQLFWQNIGSTPDRVELMRGAHVPRPTASAERPYILLNPGDGVINLTVLRFLPPDQPIGE